MAITEPHVGCFYQTPEGTAKCQGITPMSMIFALTAEEVAMKKASGASGDHLYANFSVPLDEPTLREVYCIFG